MSFSQKYGIEVPNLENVSIIEHLVICAPPRTSITITFGGEKLNNSCTFSFVAFLDSSADASFSKPRHDARHGYESFLSFKLVGSPTLPRSSRHEPTVPTLPDCT